MTPMFRRSMNRPTRKSSRNWPPGGRENMVSLSKAQTVEQDGQYYQQHYSSKIGEYYAPTQGQIIGQAIGKGAEAMGIAGNISGEQFEALLRGQDPGSDARLRMKTSRADASQRAGWDCTISPPKSISI